MLLRAASVDSIGSGTVVRVCGADENDFVIEQPSGTRFVYAARGFNRGGQTERSLGAVAEVAMDADGQLIVEGDCREVLFCVEQIGVEEIELLLFYAPVSEAGERVSKLKVYWDGGTGQMDFEQALVTKDYTGRGFYSSRIDSVPQGKYRFAVRIEDAAAVESGIVARAVLEVCAFAGGELTVADVRGI